MEREGETELGRETKREIKYSLEFDSFIIILLLIFRDQGIAPTRYSVPDTVQQNVLYHNIISTSQLFSNKKNCHLMKFYNNEKFANYSILVA